MNLLAYSTQKPEDVAPKIAEVLQKDLGTQLSIPYTIVPGDASPTSIGSVVTEGIGLLFGRSEVTLFTVVFEIPAPRKVTLNVRVYRQGIGCHAGTLMYVTQLSKPVAGEAILGAPKTFGTPKFEGDEGLITKLNASSDIVKRANAFARTDANVGGVDIKIPRFFGVGPGEGNGLLAAATLPKTGALGFKISLDAQEFCDLATLVEAAL